MSDGWMVLLSFLTGAIIAWLICVFNRRVFLWNVKVWMRNWKEDKEQLKRLYKGMLDFEKELEALEEL